MYTFDDLVELLKSRFKAIPNVESAEIEAWLRMAYAEHGLSTTASLNPSLAMLVMLYAEADGTGQVALMTAHYFSFTDKDESIDKSMISDNYLKASEKLWERYTRKRRDGVEGFGGSNVRYMRRIDRIDSDE